MVFKKQYNVYFQYNCVQRTSIANIDTRILVSIFVNLLFLILAIVKE